MPAKRRSESFDQVADLYAVARPPYPNELVTDLIALADLGNAQRVLEIGAGTGQLTVPLAERGVRLLALERGPNLARLLSMHVAGFPHVRCVIADFDEWHDPVEPFDVIIAATAFHWLDPSTRVLESARLLRAGGILALVHTHWGAGARDDRFAQESQACYARWDPSHDPSYRPLGPEDLPTRNEELESSGLFDRIVHRRYFSGREYSASAYCDLLGTFSGVLAFEQQRREEFLTCIFELIQRRFGGKVNRTDAYDLWLAQTRAIERRR